jgi:hypothetical protein
VAFAAAKAAIATVIGLLRAVSSEVTVVMAAVETRSAIVRNEKSVIDGHLHATSTVGRSAEATIGML